YELKSAQVMAWGEGRVGRRRDSRAGSWACVGAGRSAQAAPLREHAREPKPRAAAEVREKGRDATRATSRPSRTRAGTTSSVDQRACGAGVRLGDFACEVGLGVGYGRDPLDVGRASRLHV